MKITKENITQLISDYLSQKGLFLVDIDITQTDDITITIESYDSNVSLENCSEIDAIVTGHFNKDIEDYSLTVTSAGLDCPFKVEAQYVKFTGSPVEVTLKEGGKIKGTLSRYLKDENSIEITTSKMVKLEGAKRKTEQFTSTQYPLSQIKECKPVIKFK